MASGTRSILFDLHGRPIPQYWNPATVAYEAAEGARGALAVATLQTQYIDSTTALGAGASFIGTARAVGSPARVSRIIVRAFADQAGTLFVEQAHDGTTWRCPVGHSLAIAAGETRQLAVDVVTGHWRVRYANGGTAQTAFELLTAESGL